MPNSYKIPETHPDFRLNKRHYTNAELRQVAYSFIKEGEPYEQKIGNFLLDWLKPTSYIEVHTSGSTGTPKKIRLKKQHMVNSALATSRFFELPASTHALMCLPAEYIAGKMMLVRAMFLGWDLDTIPPSSNPLDQLFKVYDFSAMTPFQLDNSIARLHLVKKLIIGGGAVSPRLRKMIKDVDSEIYETYGMTETSSHIAAKKLNPKKKKKSERAFKLMPNVSIAQDERGCLIIKAPNVLDEEIVTNDVVEIITYKKFLWIGRYDNVINSGGIKLFPEQIEQKLNDVLDHRFFVTSMPDESLGEKLVLFVEDDFSEDTIKDLQTTINNIGSLGKYEKPKKIYLIEKFEETPNGKIHRENTLKSKVS
ncbi:O-succinylbenzoic acid--CoA ligase [Christiangramia gaetbulicola]|uniref:O-succinylbenzoic acid--CoA ligase n=1 Tax=Christiangramia gaetbulicola TaxID=703340 RepID=A0A2T6AEV5_9FLAO|nr:AMP-binding protein [Christiangramia gaetbulicola]PTX42337.1 O-succinylbenzoic acid--CoA ligase [Christiangramia gaetbulicola]